MYKLYTDKLKLERKTTWNLKYEYNQWMDKYTGLYWTDSLGETKGLNKDHCEQVWTKSVHG